jgi:hypothetical protein
MFSAELKVKNKPMSLRGVTSGSDEAISN